MINYLQVFYGMGKYTVTAPPEGYSAPSFSYHMDKAVGLARTSSLWPLPFATSCCGINSWLTWEPGHVLAYVRSGVTVFTPAGRAGQAVPSPKAAASLGTAEPTGTIEHCCWSLTLPAAEHRRRVLQGIDKVIPVDVYPGMPAA
ncbi:MAG: hypothetical protein U0T82_01760 [Bacteroidales bacterium]